MAKKPKPASNQQVMWAIRLRASSVRPYFSTPLFAMHLVECIGIETMAVDQHGRVYIDTSIIGPGKRWTVAQAAWVLIHELGHWLRKHHERAVPLCELEPDWHDELQKHFIKRAMNQCEDAELNDDLIAEGADLPDEGGITPTKLSAMTDVKLEDGRLFEEYWSKAKQPLIDHVAANTTVVYVDCGSAAHGVPGDYELPPPSERTPGLGGAEGDLIRRGVAREIQQLASRSPGSVPGGWERWADSILERPQVPWERELAACTRNAVTMARGMVDYSYQKPSRRGNFNGVIMAAMVRPLPDAGVVIDTSGSMRGRDLGAVLTEIKGIMRSVGQRKIPVVCCDADVQSVKRVSSAYQIELSGGGGTDMGVGIAKLTELRCKVMVVLTDGATPWPEDPPRDAQLVIGVVGTAEEFAVWGDACPRYARRVIHIPIDGDDDEEAA